MKKLFGLALSVVIACFAVIALDEYVPAFSALLYEVAGYMWFSFGEVTYTTCAQVSYVLFAVIFASIVYTVDDVVMAVIADIVKLVRFIYRKITSRKAVN